MKKVTKPKKIPCSRTLGNQVQEIMDNIPFLLMQELDSSLLEDDNEGN